MTSSPKGQNLVYRMLEHRAQVKELAENRGQALRTSLMIGDFTRAAIQVRGLPIPAYRMVQFEGTFTP